jgi:rRNA maturation protein Nop10
MNKLKKCDNCKKYTLKDTCSKCEKKTGQAHYKFLKVKHTKEV